MGRTSGNPGHGWLEAMRAWGERREIPGTGWAGWLAGWLVGWLAGSACVVFYCFLNLLARSLGPIFARCGQRGFLLRSDPPLRAAADRELSARLQYASLAFLFPLFAKRKSNNMHVPAGQAALEGQDKPMHLDVEYDLQEQVIL